MTTDTLDAPEQTGAPAVVRFAGDSGDGIQLTGLQFTQTSARHGANFMTFPEFPAEIRAPAGTTFGVSAYQIQFGNDDVLTHGDEADLLVAFNAAALATNLSYLRPGGTLIVDESGFGARDLKKAGISENPLETGAAKGFNLISIDISKRTLESVAHLEIGRKQALRSKNFWTLGLVTWLYMQKRVTVQEWISKKFGKLPDAEAANLAALDAGHAYGETMELMLALDQPKPASTTTKADVEIISGTDAMARGIAEIGRLSGREVIYCSYPITPASAVLHALAKEDSGVKTFQAEDEIAAACAAIGASYGGAIGVTASSGPGLALKTEALGLAVATELPLVIIDVQRSGPSTGMPTKPEQSDLSMAIHGRHGEAPCPVLAPATPSECLDIMIEAARIAVEAMTPVIVLSDAYLANAVSPRDHSKNANLTHFPTGIPPNKADFQPYQRDDETLARPWASPGMPSFAHRIGGLEKSATTGHISYDPDNHAAMTRLREEKVARISTRMAPIDIDNGAEAGELLIIGWGSTYGAIKQAVGDLNKDGHSIGHLHLRQLWPLPEGIDVILKRFDVAVCAELNTGQLTEILRAAYLHPVEALTQMTGQPFRVSDLKEVLLERLREAAA